MNERQKRILQILVNRHGKVTSAQIAEEMLVSIRTVKSDMPVIAEAIEGNGAELRSKRNGGYWLEIRNEEQFNTYFTVNLLTKARIENQEMNVSDRFLYVARKMIASENGLLIDDLAESLFLSRSALRECIKEADRFFASFHLHSTFTPGKGKQVLGDEYLIRMAMTELFQTHYHLAKLDPLVDEEYRRWAFCDIHEREDIRHSFLKTLRESRFRIRDSRTQKISMLLVFSRNRRKAGYCISLPPEWIEEVKQSPVFTLCKDIFANLAKILDGYDYDENETAYLAIYCLANMDFIDDCDYPECISQRITDLTDTVTEQIVARILSPSGLNVPEHEIHVLKRRIVIHLLAQHFGFDGALSFDYRAEQEFMDQPVCMAYAIEIGKVIHEITGCRLSNAAYSELSAWLVVLIARTSYPIRRLRLYSYDSMGIDAAQIKADTVQKAFPDLIEKIDVLELYEYRRYSAEDYDGALIATGSSSTDSIQGYNYMLPAVQFKIDHPEKYLISTYNTLLISAYQYMQYIPAAEAFHFYEHFRFDHPDSFFQLLALMYAKDSCQEEFTDALKEQDEIRTIIRKDTIILLSAPHYLKQETFSLFLLDEEKTWKGTRFSRILFVSLKVRCFEDLKAVSAIIEGLTEKRDEVSFLMSDPVSTCAHLIRNSLRF